MAGVGVVAVTISVEAASATRVIDDGPAVRVLVDAVAATVALFAATLAVGRFVRSRHLDDLLRASAFTILGTSSFFLGAVPVAVNRSPGAPILATLLGALILSASGVAPVRIVAAQRAHVAALGASVLAVLALGAASGFFGSPSLPFSLAGSGASRGNVAAQAAAAAFFIIAAFAFAVRAERTRDEFLYWFAAGAGLLAFARLNYALSPPGEPDSVVTADLLRLAGYVSVSVGATREIRGYWQRLAEAHVQEERRRVALTLHRDVAQGFAAVGLRLRLLASQINELDDAAPALGELARIADDALGDCRAAMEMLRAPEPLPGRPLVRIVDPDARAPEPAATSGEP